MKKELFKEAEAMLNSEIIGHAERVENYNNIINSVSATIKELENEEASAVTSGNYELLHSITERKIVAEKELEALKKNNLEVFSRKSAELKKEESTRFYRMILADLKEAEEKDLDKISECLNTLVDLLKESSDRQKRANTLLSKWESGVVPFANGERSYLITRGSSLSQTIEKNNFVQKYLNKDSSDLILP